MRIGRPIKIGMPYGTQHFSSLRQATSYTIDRPNMSVQTNLSVNANYGFNVD